MKNIAVRLLLLVFCFCPVATWAQTAIIDSRATVIASNDVGSTSSLNTILAAAPGRTTYLCGFTYQGTNPTAAANVVIAVAGIGAITGGFVYPTNAIATPPLPQPPPLVITFHPCLPANGVNTSIQVVSSGLGSGATAASLASWGYQQ
jgi:hypothetical protein